MNSKGYLKSVDATTGTGKSDSFEDVLAIEMLQSESRVEGGMKGDGARRHYGDSGNEGKGIMFSKTVEITREQKRIQGHDMV